MPKTGFSMELGGLILYKRRGGNEHEAIDRVRQKVLPDRRECQVPGRGALFDLRELVSQRRRPGPRSVQLPGNDRKARLQVFPEEKWHLVSRHLGPARLS